MPKSPKKTVRVGAPAELKRPTNLTLSPAALARAERAATLRGTSVSQLVDDLLMALPGGDDEKEYVPQSPVTRRLMGVARGSTLTREDYREYLYEKYRTRE